MKVTKTTWGHTDNKEVFLYTLTGPPGMQVRLTSYGAILVGCSVPDKSGSFEDILLGFDSLEDYVKFNNSPYFGTTTGKN